MHVGPILSFTSSILEKQVPAASGSGQQRARVFCVFASSGWRVTLCMARSNSGFLSTTVDGELVTAVAVTSGVLGMSPRSRGPPLS